MRWCLLLFLVATVSAPIGAETFHFSLLDRTYEAFIQELAPVQVGLAHVELSSPEHSLTLFDHRADLRPDGDGGHLVLVELDLAAQGTIHAAVTLGRIESELSDDLVVPRQRLRLRGRITLERVQDGYLVTPLELPESVAVRIESKLAKRLFALCHQLALVLVRMDCVALEESLSRVLVPMPPAGKSYLLPDEELSDSDRQALAEYLAAAD